MNPELPEDYFTISAARIRDRLETLRRLVRRDLGGACENAVREWLRASLPLCFGIGYGVVEPGPLLRSLGQSEPLDVLIYDALHYAPLYRDGDYVVLPTEAVLAGIEVKSNLSAGRTGHFQTALRQISWLDRLWVEDRRPAGYIFGFDGLTLRTARKQLPDPRPETLAAICVLQHDWCLDCTEGRLQQASVHGFFAFHYHLLGSLYRAIGLNFAVPPSFENVWEKR